MHVYGQVPNHKPSAAPSLTASVCNLFSAATLMPMFYPTRSSTRYSTEPTLPAGRLVSKTSKDPPVLLDVDPAHCRFVPRDLFNKTGILSCRNSLLRLTYFEFKGATRGRLRHDDKDLHRISIADLNKQYPSSGPATSAAFVSDPFYSLLASQHSVQFNVRALPPELISTFEACRDKEIDKLIKYAAIEIVDSSRVPRGANILSTNGVFTQKTATTYK